MTACDSPCLKYQTDFRAIRTSPRPPPTQKMFRSCGLPTPNIQAWVVFYNWHCTTSASLLPTHFFFNFALTQTWSLAASYWTSSMFGKQLQGWRVWTSQSQLLSILDYGLQKEWECVMGSGSGEEWPLAFAWASSTHLTTNHSVDPGGGDTVVYQQPNILGVL